MENARWRPGAAKALVPDLDLTKTDDKGLGDDGIVLKTVPPHLILTGAAGAKRGTLYAVYSSSSASASAACAGGPRRPSWYFVGRR